MRLEQLKILTEDESAMLWYIVNKSTPPVLTTGEVDISTIPSIRHSKLIERINLMESSVKEESKPIFQSLKMKLEGKTK